MAQVDEEPVERIAKDDEAYIDLALGPIIVRRGVVELPVTSTLTVDDEIRLKKFASRSVNEYVAATSCSRSITVGLRT